MPKTKEATPVFVKVLDVSTVHITEADNDYLGSDAAARSLICDGFEYGFYVYACYSAAEVAGLPISDSFKTLLLWAGRVGATTIKLDCDGEVYSHLPKNAW